MKEQRKYDLCGALDKISKGAEFYFVDYSLEEENIKFSEFIQSFKFAKDILSKNFLPIYEMQIDQTIEYLTEYYAIKYGFVYSNQLRLFIDEYDFPELKSHPTCSEMQSKLNDKFIYYLGDWITQVKIDIAFCYGVDSENLGVFHFFFNSYKANFWHEDDAIAYQSKATRIFYTPIGPTTLYANVTKDHNEFLKYDTEEDIDFLISRPTNNQFSFHTVQSDITQERYSSRSIKTTTEYAAIHKAPNPPVESPLIIHRLSILLPRIPFELHLKNLPAHLETLKQKTINKYNIPPSEFTWENVTSYNPDNCYLSGENNQDYVLYIWN